jgi:hypothetical protein
MDDWLTSVERLRKLPVTTVHAGHFDSFGRERYMAILDEYLARRRMPDFPLILYLPADLGDQTSRASRNTCDLVVVPKTPLGLRIKVRAAS